MYKEVLIRIIRPNRNLRGVTIEIANDECRNKALGEVHYSLRLLPIAPNYVNRLRVFVLISGTVKCVEKQERSINKDFFIQVYVILPDTDTSWANLWIYDIYSSPPRKIFTLWPFPVHEPVVLWLKVGRQICRRGECIKKPWDIHGSCPDACTHKLHPQEP